MSLDVYSIKFHGCKDVYPVKILRALDKFSIDHQEQFSYVLEDIIAENLFIDTVVGDNPKRSFMRNSLQFSAKNGCEYCIASGVPFCKLHGKDSDPFVMKIQLQKRLILDQIIELDDTNDVAKIESLKTIVKNLEEAEKIGKTQRQSTNVVWPANTMNGQLRTKEDTLDIVERIESGEEMSNNEKKGIKGRSLLLNLDYFDYILSMPTEYMHLVCLGGVKRLLELTFSVGESRYRNTKRPLSPPHLFNELMRNTKVVHESSRRARKLDLSVMKAQELRNLLIFFFPFVTQSLEGHEKEIKVWEMLAFMVRACILPEEEFQLVNASSIKYCQKNFYLTYQNLFGEKNCTYSIHVLSSHLHLMRAKGPLTESSAFRFESFYAELRNAFQPGTVSVLKQMFQNIILKRMLSKHVCCESIYYRPKDTPLECNSLIYVFESNVHVIYKIKLIQDDVFICNQLGNHEVEFQCTRMLNWSSVGVYRKGGLSSIDVTISKDNVCGKVLKVGKYLLTCPMNILREK